MTWAGVAAELVQQQGASSLSSGPRRLIDRLAKICRKTGPRQRLHDSRKMPRLKAGVGCLTLCSHRCRPAKPERLARFQRINQTTVHSSGSQQTFMRASLRRTAWRVRVPALDRSHQSAAPIMVSGHRRCATGQCVRQSTCLFQSREIRLRGYR